MTRLSLVRKQFYLLGVFLPRAVWIRVENLAFLPSLRGQRDDDRTRRLKAERAAALIYAHYKREFGRSTDRPATETLDRATPSEGSNGEAVGG